MTKPHVIVLSVTHQGLSKKEVATKYDVSIRWINTLIKRFNEGGIEAIQPQSRKPKTSPTAITQELVNLILDTRTSLEEQGLDAGPHSIAWQMKQAKQQPPSIPTIHRTLKRAGLIQPEPKKRPRSSYVRFQAEQPNETWQSDFTHWTLANGNDAEILNWLDDHSRLLLGCTAHKPVTGDLVAASLEACIRQYGPPQSTLTDNGLVYTSKYIGGKNALEYLLGELGIQQKNGSPHHPQTQGKIERFHWTLKKWLAQQPRANDLEQLQQQLDQWKKIYNENRPHKSLNMKTPHQIYNATIKALPKPKTPFDVHRIRVDRIDETGKVTLRRAGKMHKLGTGRANKHRAVLLLIDEIMVTVTDKRTGEIISHHKIEPTATYWPKTTNPQL